MTASILVVDDDDDIAAVLVEVLIDEGFDASSVHDGQQALDHLFTTEIDLLISDIRMPRLDGLSLVGQLRERGWTKSVVLMSAVETDIPRSIDVTFLRKPIDIEDVVQLVYQLLETGTDNSV